MAQKENKAETQIRSLPRGPAKPAPKSAPAESKDSSEPKSRRWIIYVGTASAALLLATFLMPNSPNGKNTVAKTATVKGVQKTQQSSIAPHLETDRVSKLEQDAQVQAEMLKRRRELENLQLRTSVPDNDSESYLTLPEEDASAQGVQIDTDHSAEQVYEDMSENVADDNDLDSTLPEDRINHRLMHRKWLNETERAERIRIITNFIRDAHDRGMDVEINQDLVVVGVRRVNPEHKLNINQVIDRLAKDGQ